MVGKKRIVDEELFYTFHDREIVKLLSSVDVDDKLKKGFSNELTEKFIELLRDRRNTKDLVEAIFDRDFGIDLQSKLTITEDNEIIKELLFYTEKKSDTIKYLFKNNIVNVNYKKIQEIFHVTSSDETLANKKIDEFVKYNRRATLNVCNKIIDINKEIYYCGIAKMPGIWIASSIRESVSQLIVGKTGKDDYGHDVLYSRQGHLVESCSRQLLRSDSRRFLGPCKYSITFYKKDKDTQLVRISIPTSKFVIGINISEKLLKNLFPIICETVTEIKPDIERLVQKSFKQSKKITIKKLFDFKKGEHESEFDKDSLDKKLEEVLQKDQSIRWGALSTSIGKPLCRYQKKGIETKIKGPDELEHLVETCVRQLTRKNITNIFGPIQFTFSVYDKFYRDPDLELVKISFPIGDEHLFTFNIESKPNISKSITEIFELLNDESCKEILDSIEI